MTDDAGWRSDPDWHVVEYDGEYWGKRKPPASPTPAAELAQPANWAALYVQGRSRPVVTWFRRHVRPTTPIA